MARRERAYLAEDRARAEHVAEAEEVVDAALGDIELKAGNAAQRGDLGPERKPIRLFGDEQRFDPNRIARETEGAGSAVPDRGGVHAFGAEPRFIAPDQERGEKGLDIAVGAERVAIADVATQFAVIDEEDPAGDMPLIAALAGRKTFTGQRARSRAGAARSLTLSGEVVTGADGEFAGFRGSVDPDRDEASSAASPAPRVALDQALDNVLRSPLDRIIETAERIVERADGPLRSDYATYGHDIAAAARHLLSVVGSMNKAPVAAHSTVDLAALAAEAIVMLDSSFHERGVAIDLHDGGRLDATGEERAVTQILVNLIGNAILYSPAHGRIAISFARDDANASVTVADQGPGIEAADQQRIFERFERAQSTEGGTGLGLAISRRLARSLGGDVTLDSVPGEGARFTLTLPAA